MTSLSLPVLEAGLAHIAAAPAAVGVVELIVCRPKKNERKVLAQGELSVDSGLLGDNWVQRGSWATADRKAHPDMQLNLMNSRAIALIAETKDLWPLAGDQCYVDMDLSTANLPPGSRLGVGTAVIEVTAEPHLGCRKFSKRFGSDAMKFVNSPTGKMLNLRGINARVVIPGIVKTGDAIFKL